MANGLGRFRPFGEHRPSRSCMPAVVGPVHLLVLRLTRDYSRSRGG